MIKHLQNTDINFIRWDHCINNAINGSVFAHSWYLNILNDDWEALVMGNYDYVMPLLHKIKMNKVIYYSPILGARQGVFSNNLLSDKIIQKFIDAIPKNNTVINISLNLFNQIKLKNVSYNATYELDLIQTHQKIAANYTNQFQRELDAAIKNKITIVKGLLPNELINFSQRKDVISQPRLNPSENQQLRMIMAYCLRHSLGETYCAYGEHNNLLAAAFFIKSKRKWQLLFAANSKYGIENNAFHALIDKYIEVHAEKDLTLNIENAISSNTKDFFIGLGAKEFKFQQYYANHLPFLYRLIIK